jgi:hypothetical protein
MLGQVSGALADNAYDSRDLCDHDAPPRMSHRPCLRPTPYY